MPYSCCTTAMSLSFSNSQVAATDLADPLTSSPITRASEDDDPSATRTTLTSEPFAHNPSDKAALNVASPHGVGGYVLRMPKLAEPEGPGPTRGAFDVARVERALKVIPTDGCPRRVSGASCCSSESAADGCLHPGLAGFPTLLILH